MFHRRHLVGALCLLMAALVPAAAQTPVRSVAASLSQLVTGPEGYRVLPIGLTAEQMIEVLPLRTSITLAARLGEWPGMFVSALTAILLVAGLTRRRGVR